MKIYAKMSNQEFQGIDTNLLIHDGSVTVVCNFPYTPGKPSRWAGISLLPGEERARLTFYEVATATHSLEKISLSEVPDLVRQEIQKIA